MDWAIFVGVMILVLWCAFIAPWANWTIWRPSFIIYAVGMSLWTMGLAASVNNNAAPSQPYFWVGSVGAVILLLNGAAALGAVVAQRSNPGKTREITRVLFRWDGGLDKGVFAAGYTYALLLGVLFIAYIPYVYATAIAPGWSTQGEYELALGYGVMWALALSTPLVWMMFALCAKRLRAAGYAPNLSVFGFVPVLGWLALLGMCLGPARKVSSSALEPEAAS